MASLNKGRLTPEERRKARKTPVHGASDKVTKAVGDAVGGAQRTAAQAIARLTYRKPGKPAASRADTKMRYSTIAKANDPRYRTSAGAGNGGKTYVDPRNQARSLAKKKGKTAKVSASLTASGANARTRRVSRVAAKVQARSGGTRAQARSKARGILKKRG